ncbi:hypothetical protein GCM10027570_46730 [Streptomonospora sediminis]
MDKLKPSLRADAERNRELILAAAYEAFADKGVNVSLAEIARRAGVGFATVQRRFPTKEALVTEVVRAQLAHIGQEPAQGRSLDSWQAFTAPILDCCEHQVKEPGLAGSIAQILSAASEPSVRQPILDALVPLMTRAQADGVLRDDVSVDDVLLILKANAGVIANSPGKAAEASRRFVELALRSLRP